MVVSCILSLAVLTTYRLHSSLVTKVVVRLLWCSCFYCRRSPMNENDILKLRLHSFLTNAFVVSKSSACGNFSHPPARIEKGGVREAFILYHTLLYFEHTLQWIWKKKRKRQSVSELSHQMVPSFPTLWSYLSSKSICRSHNPISTFKSLKTFNFRNLQLHPALCTL